MFNIKEFKSSFFWRCVVAELLSSLFYCFAASAVTLRLYETKYKDGVPSPRWKDPSELSMVSLTMGISVTAISFIFNVRYGGYILSTVAFGHFACWRNTLIEIVAYLLAHMLGGVAGASLAYRLSNENEETLKSFPLLNVSTLKGCILEGVLTLIVVLVTLACTDKTRKEKISSTSVVYGCVVAMAHLIAIPYTGCVLSPARILGPAIIENRWPQHLWIYWVGPFTGGILAGILYGILFSIQAPHTKDKITSGSNYIIKRQLNEQNNLVKTRIDHVSSKTNGAVDNTIFMTEM